MLRIGDLSDENSSLSVGRHRQRFLNPFSRRKGTFAFQDIAPRAPRLADPERRLPGLLGGLKLRRDAAHGQRLQARNRDWKKYSAGLPALTAARPHHLDRSNHEFRLRKYLIQNARELYGLPGASVPDIFDLKRLKIEHAACHELATKFTDNFIRVGDLYVGH